MKEKIVEVLDVLKDGNMTMNINGKPLLSVDAKSKTLGVEMSGVSETGLKLKDLMNSTSSKGGMFGAIRDAEGIAKELAEKEWNFTLYSKGEKVLAMGRGVSRLTGHIHLNPSKLFEVFGAL